MSQPYIDVSINEEDNIAIHYFDDSASAMQHLTLTDIASLATTKNQPPDKEIIIFHAR